MLNIVCPVNNINLRFQVFGVKGRSVTTINFDFFSDLNIGNDVLQTFVHPGIVVH